MLRISTELQRAKSLCADTEAELEHVRKHLIDFQNWRSRHEKELFEQLQQGVFSPVKLQQYNIKLERLKQSEIELQNVIPAVEQRLASARQQVIEAQARLQLASKANEKVDEFLSVEDGEKKIRLEKQEEDLADELICYRSNHR